MIYLINRHIADFGGAERSIPPAYFFDTQEVSRKFIELQSCFPETFELAYSLKANSELPIVDAIRRTSDSALFDVSSLSELRTVCEVGVHPSRIIFTGPGKTREELYAAIKLGVALIVCESIQEIFDVNDISRCTSKQSPILLRINPGDIDVNVAKNFSGRRSHFGISRQDAEYIAYRRKEYEFVQVAGLHFYVGSRNLDAKNIADNFFYFAKVFDELNHRFEHRLTVLDLGGGFGVPYFPCETPLDLQHLHALLAAAHGVRSWPTRVLVESGRYVSASAGVYMCQVLYTKKASDRNIAIVNGGLTSFYLPSDNIVASGGSTARNFKFRLLSENWCGAQMNTQRYDIYGNTPTSSDVLALDVDLPELYPGAILMIENAGAYGITASLNNFLGRGKPHSYYL